MTTQSKTSNSPNGDNPKSKIGCLSLVSLGPGDFQQMTLAARTALQSADVVIGYQVYVAFVRPLLTPKQKIIVSPIGNEIERAEQAIELSVKGQQVALISSGDIGIYAMASPVFEAWQQRNGTKADIQVYPGVSAIQAAAAKLGAPLGHDFCTISLSDLLTPWHVIKRRLQAAAWGDFVIGFYNPRSQKRDWQLQQAIDILLTHRPKDTPVAIVRHITRPKEKVSLTTLAQFDPNQVDMFTLVLVGNSQSFRVEQRLITPRGYASKTQVNIPSETEVQGQNNTNVQTDSDVYPITLTKMSNVLCVVVGGGPVGQRKVQGLLKAGANVRLISPEVTPALQSWAAREQIQWECRSYQTGDLGGCKLVIAATNQRDINAQIAEEAKRLGLLCNVVDKPSEGDFHVPAVHRQPELVVAISTQGKSPKRARQIRDRIAGLIVDS